MKTAIVLFNLGGPDRLHAVKPFLTNLFNDKNIIGLPQPLRGFLARVIAHKRTPVATEIYAKLGGGSPLLANTQAQARALEAALGDLGDVKTFIAMRYWHPLTPETVSQVKAYQPDRIILLSLYPQYSTTTTGSSFAEWYRIARRHGLSVPTKSICCYPFEDGFIDAIAARLKEALQKATTPPRVLFSAHGLPERVIAGGDPYQFQCEATATAIVKRVNWPDLDWVNCYQSRIGPLQWIGPATDTEIKRAGVNKKDLIVVPIAFVSEHSETLVELDLDYGHLADVCGVPSYTRLPTVDVSPAFIDGLARLARQALASDRPTISAVQTRLCPASYTKCGLDPCH